MLLKSTANKRGPFKKRFCCFTSYINITWIIWYNTVVLQNRACISTPMTWAYISWDERVTTSVWSDVRSRAQRKVGSKFYKTKINDLFCGIPLYIIIELYTSCVLVLSTQIIKSVFNLLDKSVQVCVLFTGWQLQSCTNCSPLWSGHYGMDYKAVSDVWEVDRAAAWGCDQVQVV